MRTDDNTPRDDEVGADLRQAYRRIATETTPPHLDEAVLGAAVTARTPARTGLWRWRRPLAWVTMIGLSFAIVLEFNRTGTELVPDPGESLPQTAAADAATALAGDEAAAKDERSRLAPEPAPGESRDAAVRAGQALEKAVATEAQAEKRSRDEELEAMSAPAAAELRETDAPIPAAEAPATTTPAASAPGTAADSAQALRADADRQADLYIDPGTGDEPACDDVTREDPESWRTCIADLLEAGRAGEALVEIGLYRQAFPGEPLPLDAK